jgi:Flp pilus assembly pilin Flp
MPTERNTMIQPMKRFCRLTRNSAIVTDERGLSTVEYVIILVLIAAAAVGTWTTFGKTITGKISDSNATIGSVTIPPPTQ